MSNAIQLMPFFKMMAERQASDLYVTAGSQIQLKLGGVLHPASRQVLSPDYVRTLVYELMSEAQRQHFEDTWELDFGYGISGLGRFRINIFRQRGSLSLVARQIPAKIATIKELNLPDILKSLALEREGLICITGPGGSGKSATLSAMIDHRNRSLPGHILTIEDPIESIFTHQKCIINQREVGVDTQNFSNALRSALRESPDVVMIAEIRNREAMEYAFNFVRAGYLVLTTLNVNNAVQAVNRILGFFPSQMEAQAREMLSISMKAIISQRLVVGREGQEKLYPAVEMLLQSGQVLDALRHGRLGVLRDAIERGSAHGMQSFERALYRMIQDKTISYQEALLHADSATALAWMVNSGEEEHPNPSMVMAVDDPRSISFDFKLF